MLPLNDLVVYLCNIIVLLLKRETEKTKLSFFSIKSRVFVKIAHGLREKFEEFSASGNN